MENKTGHVRAYSALILAGGQASRMGGVDKGWVCLGQTPLVRCSLAALSRQAE
ncbi:MAG: NTP transferase domain-containing protein, partial [Microvirgula sp.]